MPSASSSGRPCSGSGAHLEWPEATQNSLGNSIRAKSPTRPHGARRGSRDRARDRRGPPARPDHRARFRESGLARRHPLSRLLGRGLGAGGRDRGKGRQSGGASPPISAICEALAPLIAACAEALGPPTCLINNAARFAWDSARHARWRELAGPSRRQSQGADFPDPGLCQGPAGGAPGNVINLHRPEGAAPRPRIFLLHHRQSGAVDRHANHGPGAGPPDQGQRHRARPGAQEPGPKPGRVSSANAGRPCFSARSMPRTSPRPSASCSTRRRSPAR